MNIKILSLVSMSSIFLYGCTLDGMQENKESRIEVYLPSLPSELVIECAPVRTAQDVTIPEALFYQDQAIRQCNRQIRQINEWVEQRRSEINQDFNQD